MEWGRQRSEPLPTVLQSSVEEIDADLIRLRDEGHRLVMIDTPPSATSAISEIVRVADLVVVPCRPSPHDLRAVGATVDIVERWGRPMIFAVNSATRRAKITAEAAVALSQHGTVAPVTIHHRVDFAGSMIDGRTVMDIAPDGDSAKEIRTLWTYVHDRLERIRAPMSVTDHLLGQSTAPQSGRISAGGEAGHGPMQQASGGVSTAGYGVTIRPTFGRRAGTDG
jgi:chromosome partitioning protein